MKLSQRTTESGRRQFAADFVEGETLLDNSSQVRVQYRKVSFEELSQVLSAVSVEMKASEMNSLVEARESRIKWIEDRPPEDDVPKSSPTAINCARRLLTELNSLNTEGTRLGIFPTEDSGVEFISVGPSATSSVCVNSDGALVAARTPVDITTQSSFLEGTDCRSAALLLTLT